MLRLARVCLVSLALAGTACSEEQESHDPNQPAGKVIEMAGGVSAAREGAQTRPLAVGAAVFADDTVTTGTDGSAVILLAHNQVRWNLGQGKSVRIDRSLAWKASSDQGGSAFDDQEEMATASAGRHTDREAGDTAATAQLPPESDQPADLESAPAAPSPAAPPPPARDKVAETASSGKATTRATAPRKMTRGGASGDARVAETSKSDPFGEAPGGGATPSGGGGGAGAGRAAAAAAAPVPPAPADAPSPAPGTSAPSKPSTAGTLVLGKLTVKGALTSAQVSPRLAGLGKGCRGTAAGTLTLRFDIDGKGAVVNVRLSGPSSVVAPVSSCLTAAARGLRFPAPAGGGTTAVEREIQVSPDR